MLSQNPLSRAIKHLQAHPSSFYYGAKLSALSRFTYGKNIFELDWDVLAILDTCRVDALQELSSEYDFLPDSIDSITSVGSSTLEWVPQTFTQEHRKQIAETTIVTANPWIERILSGEISTEEFYNASFALTAWNTVDINCPSQIRTILPEASDNSNYYRHTDIKLPAENITAQAIKIYRQRPSSRLLVHYLHPHQPYTAGVEETKINELPLYMSYPDHYLRDGGDRDVVWKAYLDELRAGLDAVDRLFNNIDADNAAITADHGELFGRYLNGHPPGSLHPKVRRVPWVTTEATNTENWNPSVSVLNNSAIDNAQLEALGYR